MEEYKDKASFEEFFKQNYVPPVSYTHLTLPTIA